MGRFNINTENYAWYMRELQPTNELYTGGIAHVFAADQQHQKAVYTETKIDFLDRAYSAGLRRWVKKGTGKHNDESPAYRCAERLHKKLRGRDVSDIMNEALAIGPSLTEQKLEEVGRIFTEFQGRLQPLLRMKANLKSFYSKYLWFHAGVFPIYDRDARLGMLLLSDGAVKWGEIESYKGFAKVFVEFIEDLHLALGKQTDAFEPSDIKIADMILVQSYRYGE